MPWIRNVSLQDVKYGNHRNAEMLIQITDPCVEPPTPRSSFKEVYQFEFLDTDDVDNEFACTSNQAAELVNLLQHALNTNMNVIVHCHAGICRSGAVTEVGVMMGFEDTGKHRIPNVLVKTLMVKELGWSY